jgi:hypothetical protein
MTDLAKAIAFATYCLKWTDVRTEEADGVVACDSGGRFHINGAAALEYFLQQFLGKRYFIQINRGTTDLFHWRVIVGLQDLSVKGACWDHAIGVGEDLWDAIFDACVAASRL